MQTDFSKLEISKTCSFKDVINFLVRERMKCTQKRKRLLRDHPDTTLEQGIEPIQRICPPRRMWAKFRPLREARKTLTRSEIQSKSLKVCMESGLNHTHNSFPGWAKRLFKTLELLDQQYQAGKTLEFPKLVLIDKDVEAGRPPAENRNYRVIAMQQNLIDRMLHSLVSRYLQREFSSSFGPNVYGLSRNKTSSHAVGNLIEYRKDHHDEVIWVSEIDIRQFFDTVSHKQVMAAFQKRRTISSNQRPVEAAALKVIDNFLNQYSFQKVEELIQAQKGASSLMPEELRSHLQERNGVNGYGIPQGSPFSSLIANLMLTTADTRVEAILDSQKIEGFYARFVDDVIMLHPQKETCQRLHDAYQSALEELALVPHPPLENTSTHPRDYLDHKTLKPYPWCHPKDDVSAYRWVAFLGYHIREDLQIRLRRSTFEKELLKQKKIVDRVLNRLRDLDYVRQMMVEEIKNPDGASLAFLTELQLVARTVGRDILNGKRGHHRKMCWNAAFPHLNANQQAATQLRKLDQHREKQIRRLKAQLRKLGLSDKNPEWYSTCKYFGHPYSYYSLLNKQPTNNTGQFRKTNTDSFLQY